MPENMDMDMAADEARDELKAMDKKSVKPVADWWYKWYLSTGHKRLGRVLVEFAKENK